MQARDWREAQTDANGRPLYGIDMEIQAKLDAKRDPEKELQVRAWMEELVGQPWPSDNIQTSLKDGILLCKLVNAIQPGCVKTINTSKLAFKQMENINNFLTAAKTLGVRQVDLFTTIDLFEARNLPAVVTTLFCLGSAAQKLPGYTGPIIGVKFADKNERNFSEEQLAQAAAAPSRLAMGSYGLASQAGTRSISREVVKSSDAGSSSETSKLLQGSHGLASQSGSRSISREVVRSNSVGSSEMSRQTMGAYGGANQSGYRSGAHDVVRGTAEYRPAQAGHHEAEPQYEQQQYEGQYEAPAEGLEQDNVLEDLEKLAVLRDKGIISEDEFQEKKRELLGL